MDFVQTMVAANVIPAMFGLRWPIQIGGERHMSTQPISGPVQAAAAQPSQKTVEVASRSVPPVQIAPKQLSQDVRKAFTNLSAQQQVPADEMKRASEELQRRISAMAPELQFSVDHDSGRTIIKVTDPSTNELIRQIPAEEVLQLNKELDRLQGLLLNHKA